MIRQNTENEKTILVAGATGNLGGKIARALLQKGAKVKALVRLETEAGKIKALENLGVHVIQVDLKDTDSLVAHLVGVHCVVSALSGLEETLITTQKSILDAAVQAKVPRFIPSDYSIDFTNLVPGQNRNLDLRRSFHLYLDQAAIQATSIFNGAFMDLLTTDMPLILFKRKRILCWGNPDQPMEFTTTFNVAEFTANVALDESTPRYMHVAGDRLSCEDFVELLSELTRQHYKLFRPGGIWLLNTIIKLAKFFSPAKGDLYPAWQGMQYMRDMMEGRIVFKPYENERYPEIEWTSVRAFLKQNATLQ